jgi:hypothetical protein
MNRQKLNRQILNSGMPKYFRWVSAEELKREHSKTKQGVYVYLEGTPFSTLKKASDDFNFSMQEASRERKAALEEFRYHKNNLDNLHKFDRNQHPRLVANYITAGVEAGKYTVKGSTIKRGKFLAGQVVDGDIRLNPYVDFTSEQKKRLQEILKRATVGE